MIRSENGTLETVTVVVIVLISKIQILLLVQAKCTIGHLGGRFKKMRQRVLRFQQYSAS